MRFAAQLFAILLAASTCQATQIEGVKVPPTTTVSGTTLQLNGAGLRTFTLVLIPIKIYVAAFYTPAPLRTATAVSSSPGPMKFVFTFLRGVSKNQVGEAWSSQFQASASFTYAGFDKDRSEFIGMFGPIAPMGTQAVEFVGDNTNIYDAGKLKGTIVGRNFQKAFLSLWFGSNPVSPDLKSALLGK